MNTQMNSAEAAVQAYLARVRAGDAAGLSALFAETGAIDFPGGRRVVGRAAIAAEYTRVFSAVSPSPQLVNLVAQGECAAAEILAQRADGGTNRAADFFRVNAAGEIIELRIYM